VVRWSALLVLAIGCTDRRSVEVTRVPDELEAPTPDDHGDLCADVSDVRVCWKRNDDAGPSVVPRPLPRHAPPDAGYRCYGSAEQRRCVDRAKKAGAFSCSGESCVQTRPRLPSAGEWECAEMEGIVYCHGGDPPAGVPPSSDDPSWICGARGKTSTAAPERVCVDLSPERPLVEPGKWACRFEYAQGLGVRRCVPNKELRVGAVCKTSKDCPEEMTCAGRKCVPRDLPAPDCWHDKDCESPRVCRYGTCVRSGR